MYRVLWIGARGLGRELRESLVLPDVELLEFVTADQALATTLGLPLAAAIVSADWGDAAPAVAKLREVRPDLQVLAATKLGVPMHIGLVLNAGATHVLDLAARDTREMSKQVRDALERHIRARRERELLLRLRELNEKFLKNLVSLEKKNIELEEKVEADALNESGEIRILVIDDEPAICTLLEMMLIDEGYQVDSVGDGEAGLAAFKSIPYSLVLTDKNLPGISGLDVLRSIKHVRPSTDVIMITGYASKESAMEALNLGATTYIEKPFDIDDVAARIKKVIDAQKMSSRRRRHLLRIKERNKNFLDEYRSIRADLEAWLEGKEVEPKSPSILPRPPAPLKETLKEPPKEP